MTTGEIRALSVRQPYAWAIAIGAKPVENRTFGTRYRGLLAIHASKVADRAALGTPLILEAIADRGFVIDEGPSSLGAVVAVAELYGIHHAHDCMAPVPGPVPTSGLTGCSPWAMYGQWHWQLRDVRPLPVPVPCKGRLGLWWLPVAAEKAVREAVLAGSDVNPAAGDTHHEVFFQ